MLICTQGESDRHPGGMETSPSRKFRRKFVVVVCWLLVTTSSFQADASAKSDLDSLKMNEDSINNCEDTVEDLQSYLRDLNGIATAASTLPSTQTISWTTSQASTASQIKSTKLFSTTEISEVSSDPELETSEGSSLSSFTPEFSTESPNISSTSGLGTISSSLMFSSSEFISESSLASSTDESETKFSPISSTSELGTESSSKFSTGDSSSSTDYTSTLKSETESSISSSETESSISSSETESSISSSETEPQPSDYSSSKTRTSTPIPLTTNGDANPLRYNQNSKQAFGCTGENADEAEDWGYSVQEELLHINQVLEYVKADPADDYVHESLDKSSRYLEDLMTTNESLIEPLKKCSWTEVIKESENTISELKEADVLVDNEVDKTEQSRRIIISLSTVGGILLLVLVASGFVVAKKVKQRREVGPQTTGDPDPPPYEQPVVEGHSDN